jgi:cyclophilin family peptidyl-prolyl cis-trans isomerase
MIQGGGFTPDMKQKDTKPPIANESNNGLKNDAYTVAMARTSVPDSATSQFFINVANNDFLNYPAQDGFGYCVFGKVTEGMDTIDKIKNMATGNHPNGHQDVPIEAIIIEEVSV